MRVDTLGLRSLRSCNHFRYGSHWNIGETNVCRWTKKKPSFFEVASLVTDMRVSLDAKKQTAYERYKKRKKHGSGFTSWTLEFLCQQKLA